MTVPITPASLLDIQNEYGGVTPIALNQYYAGGAYVVNPPPSSAYGVIPTSGTISIGLFRGTSKNFVFNDIISANLINSAGYNLVTRAVAAGWNSSAPLIASITVNAGVVITSSTGYAFTCQALPTGSSVSVLNNGSILGYGGAGGVGGTNGAAGGQGGAGLAGLNIQTPITLTNNGLIAGGGSGGGGGGGLSSSDGKGTTYVGGGGGGGGGNSTGLAGGAGAATSGTSNANGAVGAAGGTTSSGTGTGGGVAGVGGLTGGGSAGAGGQGGGPGNYGHAGAAGTASGGTAGALGLLVTGGAFITWLNYGKLRGALNSNWYGTWGGTGPSNAGLMSSLLVSAQQGTRNAAWTTGMGTVWYASFPSDLENAPASANAIFCTLIYVAAVTPVHLYGAADNNLTAINVNGSASGATMPFTFTSVQQSSSFNLPIGLNIVSITVFNASGGAPNPAGFALRVRRSSDNTTLSDLDQWFR